MPKDTNSKKYQCQKTRIPKDTNAKRYQCQEIPMPKITNGKKQQSQEIHKQIVHDVIIISVWICPDVDWQHKTQKILLLSCG